MIVSVELLHSRVLKAGAVSPILFACVLLNKYTAL